MQTTIRLFILLLKIYYVIYMTIVTLLLLNLLIAMMGNTYSSVHESKKEWIRQVS